MMKKKKEIGKSILNFSSLCIYYLLYEGHTGKGDRDLKLSENLKIGMINFNFTCNCTSCHLEYNYNAKVYQVFPRPFTKPL